MLAMRAAVQAVDRVTSGLGPMGAAPALETRLHALEARVLALEAAEAARAQRQRVTGLRRGDAALLGQLLPVLASLLGSEEFLARDLAATRYPLLRALLAERSKKTIGRLLARAEGIAVGDYQIAARGDELGVRKYAVVGFFGLETPTGRGRAGTVDR